MTSGRAFFNSSISLCRHFPNFLRRVARRRNVTLCTAKATQRTKKTGALLWLCSPPKNDRFSRKVSKSIHTLDAFILVPVSSVHHTEPYSTLFCPYFWVTESVAKAQKKHRKEQVNVIITVHLTGSIVGLARRIVACNIVTVIFEQTNVIAEKR